MQRADEFTGFYMTTRRAYSGLEGFVNQLTGGSTVTVTHDGKLVTVDGAGVKTWVQEDALDEGRFIATQGSERLAFDLADGGAKAFHGANGTQVFERAPFWRQPRALTLLAALTAAAALAIEETRYYQAMVQAEPLRVNELGLALLPVCVAWKPTST